MYVTYRMTKQKVQRKKRKNWSFNLILLFFFFSFIDYFPRLKLLVICFHFTQPCWCGMLMCNLFLNEKKRENKNLVK